MLCSKGREGSSPSTGTTWFQDARRWLAAPAPIVVRMSDNNDGALITPGNTATGAGTSMGENPSGESLEDAAEELGTTDADVTDGSEQKQPLHE